MIFSYYSQSYLADMVWSLRYVLLKSELESRLKQAVFLSSRTSKPALGPTKCSVRRVLGSFRRKRGRGAMLTVHPYLVPRLRMSGVTTPLPLYTFKAWIGKSILLLCHFQKAFITSGSKYSYYFHGIWTSNNNPIAVPCFRNLFSFTYE